MQITQRPSRSVIRRSLGKILLALVVVSSAACDSLLGVDNPGRVPVEALDDPNLAPALAAAAIQQFQCGAVAFAVTGGMLSGEYLSANGFVNNHIWEWRGVVQIKDAPGSCNTARGSTFLGFYTPLQEARFQLDDAYDRISTFSDAQVPNRARTLTEMRAYAGYALTLLGEGMCQMAIDRGPAMTRAQVLAIAEQRFNDAITQATAINDVSLLNMARVGRARVRLDLGNLTGAAADAILVPAGFVRNAEFTEGGVATRENRIYNLTVRVDFLSTGNYYRNLTVSGQPDPRVRVRDMGRNGSDGATRIWQQQKFLTGAGGVAMPVASWAEAQLIYAEAVGGSPGLDAINRVRTANGVPTIASLPSGSFVDLVLEERRRQLYSEGQRYADMLRRNLPFEIGVNGVNRKGQTFSNLTCVPLPDVETRNNPNFSG